MVDLCHSLQLIIVKYNGKREEILIVNHGTSQNVKVYRRFRRTYLHLKGVGVTKRKCVASTLLRKVCKIFVRLCVLV